MKTAVRPRRNRRSKHIRELVAETSLNLSQIIYPLFFYEGSGKKESISTMPGIFRFNIDSLLQEIEECQKLGLHSFALFPKIAAEQKDSTGKAACDPNGLVPKTIQLVKETFPDVVLFSDVALDPYSSEGHDGLVRDGTIVNDESVELLAEMALVQAQAGVDFVAPSDMMDGRVGAIRKKLDQVGYEDVGILAYAAKYASGFYGPFRDALDSAPKFGDKKTYQMDFRNSREALREIQLDIKEGADIVMIKPALCYLDVIRMARAHIHVPLAAYNVSGEYTLIKAAAQYGMDSEKLMLEVLLSIRRAGADIILTYFAKELAHLRSRI